MTTELLRRLSAVCGAPKSEDPATFLAEYARLVERFGPDTQKKAGDALLAAAGHRWPSPKELVQACVDAQEALAGKAASARAGKPEVKMPWEIKTEQAQKWAEDYVARSPLGHQAITEGWRDQLRAYAYSFARNSKGDELPPFNWRPPEDVIDYYRRPYLRRTQA